MDKFHVDRLVELEEKILYLLEILDSVHFLETCIQEIYEKDNAIDA